MKSDIGTVTSDTIQTGQDIYKSKTTVDIAVSGL